MAKVAEWESKTTGGTVGEMSAYADKDNFSIAFRENGHKKVVYQFRSLSDLSDAINALKKGWLSSCRGK